MASKYNAAVHTPAPDINKTEWAILNHRSMKQKKTPYIERTPLDSTVFPFVLIQLSL